MRKTKLKPCPFCGGKAAIHRCAELENDRMAIFLNEKCGVHCEECKVATQPFNTEQKAADAWNRRKRSDILTEAHIEAMENALREIGNMQDPLEPARVSSALLFENMRMKAPHPPGGIMSELHYMDGTVIAALWKQTPIMAEVNEWMTYPEKVPFGRCPECGERINGAQTHCDRCGQKVKWPKAESYEG